MSLTNFNNFQPMNEKLNKSDVKYSMELAFANQGGNWFKALKKVDVKGDKIKLNMSSYMAPGELLQKIVDEFNDIMLSDFKIDKDSFKKGGVTSVMLIENVATQVPAKTIALDLKDENMNTINNLNSMANTDLERIGDYADMIKDRMSQGQQLDAWMYSKISDSVKNLNSVHDTMDGNDGVTEAKDYEFNPSESARRLKDREKENIQRYRAAQDRGDNFAIALYELKIKMDKIDLEGLKVQTAIHDLKKKFGK